MSKLAKEVKEIEKVKREKRVVNFMDGVSFELDPITTLKMVAASSIFSEPQYYRENKKTAYIGRIRLNESAYKDLFLFNIDRSEDTSTYMERIIDEALNYNFKEVLDVAISLRNDFNMRLNPQVIMVRAAMHPNRQKFNEENPGYFKECEEKVMRRADEPSTQFAYYLHSYNGKNKLPSILKRSWAEKLSSLSRYQMAKYKNAEMGMIDVIRVCHAKSDLIDELMTTGTIQTSEDEKTWENLRSAGHTWKQIFTEDNLQIPHMALLRNLRGIAKELTEEDKDLMKALLERLVAGVEKGRQFPYRYYVAYNEIKKQESISFKVMIMEALEDCLQKSLDNLPYLEGKTMVLSDNSGSAWGAMPSEYGIVRVAEIGNLSAVLTAMRSEEGYVGVFGDELTVIPIKKNSSVLDNLEKVNEAGRQIGKATETGIWLFFRQALTKKEHWDNLFIYSDMQAGYGHLYCSRQNTQKYISYLNANGLKKTRRTRDCYVDVLQLVNEYRKINPKFNVFSIQTAGYNNSVLPQYCYRSNLLYGWTGKELVFAKRMIDLWDEVESNQSQNVNKTEK